MTPMDSMTLTRVCLLLVLSLGGLGCTLGERPNPGDASIIMHNGQVKTPSGWAEALAIDGTQIVAVGTNEEALARGGNATQVIDLEGAVVLPGFHDAHVHPLFGGMTYSGADHTNCQISQGSNESQLLETLEKCVARVSVDEWITGGQWDASTLERVPHRRLLDTVAPNVPVIINDTSGHSAWANSKALAVAGVTKDTPNPPGGIIERDDNGEPTGVLREEAIGLVRGKAPPPSAAVIKKALQWSLNEMLAVGITSFTEASNGFVAGSMREANNYVTLAEEGVLKHRVRVCMNLAADNWTPGDSSTESLINDRRNYDRDRLIFDCVKIFLDGVPTDSHTAAMIEPYAGTIAGRDDKASRYGLLLWNRELLNQTVTELDAQGLSVKFHAAGDAAVRAGLNAVAAAREANGMSKTRHDVAHCTFVKPEDLDRAESIGATIEMSPYLWSPSPINMDIARAIGPERIKRVWPVRDAIDRGALVVVGSDWSVVPSVSPWIALEALVTRERPGGSDDSWGKGQSITVAEAVDLFTINASRHNGTDDSLGKIQTGYLADVIVVDQNPYSVPATDLHKTKTMMTIIDGEVVYDGREP